MNKVFFDTDVILDLLLDRKPFADDIAEIMEESVSGTLRICVSSVTITNLNYILRKIEGRRKADTKTKKILQLVHVENVGQSTVKKAVKSKFKDFEDGVQNYSAVEAKHEIIVTRNMKDYVASELAIMTPKEYLAKIKGRH